MNATMAAALLAALVVSASAAKAQAPLWLSDPSGVQQGTAAHPLVTTSASTAPGAAASSPTFTAPGSYSVVDPDIATITTAGTPVNAFAAGNTIKGGYVHNPVGAAGSLCIRQTGSAPTVEGGGTFCISAGQGFILAPSNAAVSVNAADAGHVFSGQGWK